MSQAYNLGKFANTLNTSGQIDVTTGISGTFPTTNLPTIPINKGGTNLTTIGANGTIVSTDGSAYTYGSASGALTWDTVKTSSFTAVAGYGYLVNTTSSTITVTLPASPSIGQSVVVVDYAGTFATNNVTVDPNGSKINTGSSKLLQTNRMGITFIYIDATQGWLAQADVYSGNPPFIAAPINISYLIVAGGGGSGIQRGGGGGAGGLLSGTTSLTSSTTYTITVGGGGATATTTSTSGSLGSNSSFTGLTTAVGGGGGNGYPAGSGGSQGSGSASPGVDGTLTTGGNGGNGSVDGQTSSGAMGGGGGGGGSLSGQGGSGAGTPYGNGSAGNPATTTNGGNGGNAGGNGSADSPGSGGINGYAIVVSDNNTGITINNTGTIIGNTVYNTAPT